jgi:hypothetical protein
MAHVQKTVFVFRRNGRVHLNRRGASVQSTTGSRGVRISCSNARYIMFRGSVKSTGYPLHSPVSPSFLFQCVTVCRHISTGLYHRRKVITSAAGNRSPFPLQFTHTDSGPKHVSYLMGTGKIFAEGKHTQS